MEYLVRDVVPRMTKNYRYSLIDIGMVVNQLMGAGYRSSYTRRKFRLRYEYSQEQARLAEAAAAAKTNNGGNSAAGTPLTSAGPLLSPGFAGRPAPYKLLQRGLQKTATETSFKVLYYSQTSFMFHIVVVHTNKRLKNDGRKSCFSFFPPTHSITSRTPYHYSPTNLPDQYIDEVASEVSFLHLHGKVQSRGTRDETY